MIHTFLHRTLFFSACIVLLAVAGSAPDVFAQNVSSTRAKASDLSALDKRIHQEIASFHGRVNLYAKNLDTGASYSFKGDEAVRTASTIKVAIMVEAFARVAEGRSKWSDELTLTEGKKVSGSGVLIEFADGLHLTLRDAVNMMIVVSDNTATNLVLDVLTADAVNARMDALGFKDIRILRKIGGGGVSKAGELAENKKYGLGKSTPQQMVLLLEKLERGEIVSAAASKEMIALLKREQSHEGIGRDLRNVALATKSGALDGLRANVGIIYSPRGRIAMAITCDDMPEVNWTVDNPGLLMLSKLSDILLDGLE